MVLSNDSESILELLSNNLPKDRKVLSIQSHVVHGYAGNKCSVFPLQLHGYEVDPLNSVQLSNHTGYKYFKGEKLSDKNLGDLYDGLKLNDINHYSHILTGYCGATSFLQKVVEIVRDLKRRNPHVYYICDPVLGDNGQYYTPKEMMEIYRDQLIPMANVVTPNIFELSEISGLTVTNEAECLSAIDKIHSLGVKAVVVTSGLETNTTKYCYCSLKNENGDMLRYRFDIPVVKGNFVGTGDVFTSLLLIWLDKFNGDLRLAVEKAISSIQSILRRTIEGFDDSSAEGSLKRDIAELELCLVRCRLELLCPKLHINSLQL